MLSRSEMRKVVDSLPRRISGEVDSEIEGEEEIGREGKGVIASFSPFYSNIQRRRAFPASLLLLVSALN